MAVSLRPYGSNSPDSGYIAWAPVPLVVASAAGGGSGTLRLNSISAAGSVAKVVFLQARDKPPQSEIEIELQAGEEKTIFIAGEFQRSERHHGASVEGKDITVRARWAHDSANDAASVEIMIRVRRNANELSDQARKDFLFALAKLNGIKVDDDPTPGPGFGVYVTDFVAQHVDAAELSQHGDSHFLPWHRLYLLDLERQLQAVKPTVTLPYWKFDQAAPNIFTEDFMGDMLQIPRDTREPGGNLDDGSDTPPARFAVDNYLAFWQIGNTKGIPRAARFDPQKEPANGLILVNEGQVIDFLLMSENATLGLGGGVPPADPEEAKLGGAGPPRSGFSRMEGSPHGAAHLSFNGRINVISTAPQDPLFFLVHCNVDRLWAVWQSMFNRDDKNDTRTYPYQKAGDADPWEIISASAWPWDGTRSHPRDETTSGILPPGTRQKNFARSSLVVNFPDNSPLLEHAIDPYANHNPDHYLGFSYDDVPYDHVDPVTS